MGRLAVVVVAVAALAAALGLAPIADGHPESAAPALRSDVVRAGHEPEVVQPHSQWRGFLELRDGHDVTAAFYQVCRVGDACFAPPAPATAVGEGRFEFDTSEYLANGRPVDYEAGWRLGVTWVLEERQANGSTMAVRFPAGPDLASPECMGDAALACSEQHYLAFDVAGKAGGRGAPSAGVGALATLSLLAAASQSRRSRR